MTRSRIPRRVPRSLGAAAVPATVLASALLLAGCGGSSSPAGDTAAGKDDVASLQTASAPPAGDTSPTAAAPSPSTAADQGRPQLRLDMTDAETQVYWEGYWKCLKEHGHKMNLQRGPYSVDQNDNSPTAKAAEKACAGKLPLQPPETERETNPDFDEDYRDYIACLNDGGLHVTALPGNTGWTYTGTNTLSPEKSADLDLSCKVKSFGGKHG
ncbi:hypothetical protein [Streptomyces sp. MI02-7b]|uniref:hypothetical protein n=1 Tax=Streptomyces sp. MI02-7b TaxID=462941 RepID=UPI0029B8B57B|nr:hypothetical protein [Streptomyces sp. MI02-7b]MDX3073431.1 hypothetical protein [Streptomyces sp. MI02-7b]